MRESKVIFFRPSLPKPSVHTVEWRYVCFESAVRSPHFLKAREVRVLKVPVNRPEVTWSNQDSNKVSETVIDPGQMIIMDP
ncbi:hypothetical protein H0H93_002531, partial [Arthromyces matolae]